MSLYSHGVVQADMDRIVSDSSVPFEQLKDKTILITGATGMLAYYMTCVCMHLNRTQSYNIHVIALVRNELKAKAKFEEFMGDEHFELCVQDVCQPINLNEHIDYIVHAAGAASPWFIKHDPVGIVKVNTIGTMNVMECAKESGASNVLFLSTREIYGEVKGVSMIKETDMGIIDPKEPRSCYPESKRMSEQILQSYYSQYKVPYTLARIAHSYGPGMIIENDGRVMSDFICDTVHRRNIVLKSEGLAERAFCYITDAVTALFIILLKGTVTEAYNVANETEPTPIKDVAQKLVELFPENNRQVIFEIAKDTSGYCAYKRVGLDTTKLEELGWSAKVKLEDGMKNTVLSFE